MTYISHIKLHNVPESLEPGDTIECTIDDVPHDAEFVRQGSHERIIWVRIRGLREVSNGKLTTQLDMFDPSSFVTEFVVNDAPGRDWHRGAGMKVEVE